jgi:translocation and assembly module TamB
VWRLAAADRGPGLDVRGTFASLDLRRVPRQLAVPPVPSRLNGRYTLATSRGAWRVDGVLAASEAAGAAIGAGTIGHAESSGGALRWSAEGRLANLDLQQLSAPLSIETLGAARYDSQLTGAFHVAGTRPRAGASTAIEGGASLVDSRLGGTRMPAMDASVTLAGRRLSVDADGAFEHLDAAAITGASSPSRAVDLTGSVDGVFVIDNLDVPIGPETIDFDGRVTLEHSTIEGVELTRALIDAQLLDGLATVRELTAEGPDAHVKAEGVVALAEEAGESSLRVDAEVADLAAIGRHIARPLTGSATVAATITGPPSALRAAGTIEGQQLEYGKTASALTLASTFTAVVPDLQLARARVDATTEATLLSVGGVEMVRAAATTRYGDRRLEIDGKVEQTNRTLDMAGVLTLEPEARAVELTRLALSTAGTSWSLPAGEPARIRYGSDSVSVEHLALVNQAQRIDADGVLSAGGGTALSAAGLTVRLSAVQLAEINRLLLGTRQLGGEVNGVAHVSGSLKAPAVDAELSVTNGTVENVKYEGLTATVKSDGPVLHVNATLAQTAANRLTAVGTMPYRFGAAAGAAPGEMDLRVESTPIELGLAQMFTTEVSEVVGTGTVNAHVTGPFSAPKVDGVVTLAGGGFLVSATGVRYTALNATLGFESSHLRIDAFHIADDDGHVLTAEGGVDVVAGAQGRALDVHLRGEDFHILRNRLGDVAVDTDLRASGTVLAPRIEGSIRVDEGRLEVDQILERTTKNAYSTTPAESLAVDPASPVNPAVQAATATAPAPASGSVFDQMELRLNVSLPDNLVLRGRDMRVASTSMGLGDMNIIAGGSFDVTKPAGAAVAAQGTLEIQRGYYSFQGKRFEVQRGSDVRFRGGPPTNPTLQISAEREVSGVTAAVQIRGTARNPRIALSSRPPLDESDILSLIIFDRPVNDLASAERVSLAERAGSLAANAIATPLADSVARALNLDVFEIQTGASSGTSPAVTLGSQIGSRLFVGIRQEFGHGDASTVTFEYRVNQLLRLVTSVAYGTLQASATRRIDTGGIDLIYLIRY